MALSVPERIGATNAASLNPALGSVGDNLLFSCEVRTASPCWIAETLYRGEVLSFAPGRWAGRTPVALCVLGSYAFFVSRIPIFAAFARTGKPVNSSARRLRRDLLLTFVPVKLLLDGRLCVALVGISRELGIALLTDPDHRYVSHPLHDSKIPLSHGTVSHSQPNLASLRHTAYGPVCIASFRSSSVICCHRTERSC